MTDSTCRAPECERERRSRGLCSKHYQKFRSSGEIASYPALEKAEKRFRKGYTCTVEECPRPRVGRGYCKKHYTRFMKHGDPLTTRPPVDPLEYGMRYFGEEDPNGCIEWTGSKFGTGYGKFMVDGKRYSAHRWSYERFIGPIPEGMVVRHKCDNRPCVNPEHLLVGTQRQNCEDTVERERTARGERSGMSKLTETEAVEIYQLAPRVRHADIAEMYNITMWNVSSIARGLTWAWRTGAKR